MEQLTGPRTLPNLILRTCKLLATFPDAGLGEKKKSCRLNDKKKWGLRAVQCTTEYAVQMYYRAHSQGKAWEKRLYEMLGDAKVVLDEGNQGRGGQCREMPKHLPLCPDCSKLQQAEKEHVASNDLNLSNRLAIHVVEGMRISRLVVCTENL